MNKNLGLLIAIFITFITSISAFAQSTISGKVLNLQTSQPIQDVNVTIEGENNGTTTSPKGIFSVKTNSIKAKLTFTAIGYKSKNVFVKSDNNNQLEIVYLQPAPYPLDEILINAGLSNTKELPVSINTINAKQIEIKLGNRPLPLVMQATPGVFSTRVGGGSGDSKLSIRGFQQENVSLLLNGISINGQENGLVYWSNWLGLSTSAAEIQIQKGPGLANSSTNSIGGTINIITTNAQSKKSGLINFEVSSYGSSLTTIAINTGKLKNGWSTSLMMSYGNGNGYVDATFAKSFAYFFTSQKQINNKHKVTITLLGAPQEHQQQTIKLSDNQIQMYGNKYNSDWGGYNGQIKTASKNFYHKPFFSINHEYKINKNNTLSTSGYFSVGYGGGRWSESFNYAPSIFTYRNYSGQIDWQNIYENNATNQNNYILENGEIVTGYSLNVQTIFLASHVQTGIVSNFQHKINNKLTFNAGVHYRYFNSFVREVVDDLLGGNFFIEDYGWSLAGVAGRNQIKTVGDIIRVNNNSIINFASAHTQLVYSNSKINAFISASTNNNWYTRIDRFNYINNTKSETVSKISWDIRSGFLYNLNENQNIYINAAVISRAPFFKYIFGNYTNVVVQNIKNENVKTVEIGHKAKWNNVTSSLNAYFTSRQNISILTNEYVQIEDNTQSKAMINGLNATHKGVEFEIKYKINNNTQIGGILAVSDYKWQNNVSARLLNNNNVVIDTVNVYLKGINIGGTAQQQYGLFANFAILKSLFFSVEYLYYGNMYANFNATQRNNPNNMSQPYKLPSYGVVNTYLQIPFTVSNYHGNISISAYNLFDKNYITMGDDGADHNLESFRGFWSYGRNFNFGVRMKF